MTSYAVRLEVPLTARAGDRTAAIVGRLDDRLAAWPGKAVRDAQLESQLGRGGRVGKVRATMTVQAADAAGALAVALEVLRQAIGADARSWDVAAAAATVAPAGGAAPEPLRRPNLVWRKPLPGHAAIGPRPGARTSGRWRDRTETEGRSGSSRFQPASRLPGAQAGPPTWPQRPTP
jgi:hypothetical protein